MSGAARRHPRCQRGRWSAQRQFAESKWRNAMATVTIKSSMKPGPGRMRAQDTDRHVGARMRERRIMLGLTQHQMAEMVGVTYQQAHKYEKGINRVAAGRLYHIAQALGVEVGYFFEGLGGN